MRAERVFAVLVLITLAAVAGTAFGQTTPAVTPEIQAVHSRMVAELMSPFCHGLTLDNCPTSGASQMRDQILAWLVEGRSEDWIVETLVEEWGETILGAPRFRGVGIVAWLAPGVVLLVAGVGLVFWLRRSTASVPTPVAASGQGLHRPRSAGQEDDPLLRRVDEEVGALIE